MINEKSLRNAAKELQEVMGLEPALDVKAKLPVLTEQVKEAIGQIDPNVDVFSDQTQAVIDELSGAEEEEEEAPVTKKKAPAKKAPEPEPDEEEDEEKEEEEVSLEDQIQAAQKLSELTAIAKANPEFKALRAKLSGYTKASQLKAVMLGVIIPEDEEEEEEVPAPKKKVTTPAKKAAPVEEDENEPVPSKKGKLPNFVPTKETLGTNRGIEVAKVMQAIKGAQTIDELANLADKNFVKKGGSSNLKQAKNIIKNLLQVAEEWGIIAVKNGKISNP